MAGRDVVQWLDSVALASASAVVSIGTESTRATPPATTVATVSTLETTMPMIAPGESRVPVTARRR